MELVLGCRSGAKKQWFVGLLPQLIDQPVWTFKASAVIPKGLDLPLLLCCIGLYSLLPSLCGLKGFHQWFGFRSCSGEIAGYC